MHGGSEDYVRFYEDYVRFHLEVNYLSFFDLEVKYLIFVYFEVKCWTFLFLFILVTLKLITLAHGNELRNN